MDDPFGCLQGEKISPKMIKEMLQKKKNEINLLSKKIDRCPSCDEQLIYVVNEFCHACKKCDRVIECDDYEYFEEEENLRTSSTALPQNNDHLKKVLRKCNIHQMFSSKEVDFLGNVIAQFKDVTSKSVNYTCFLYNYFERVPSERWPNKKEILKSIYCHHLPKDLERIWISNQEFDKWWLKANQTSS